MCESAEMIGLAMLTFLRCGPSPSMARCGCNLSAPYPVPPDHVKATRAARAGGLTGGTEEGRADEALVRPAKDRRDDLSVRGRRLERGGPAVAIGWSELRRRIARHSRVTHHASLAVLVGPGPVEHAAVVPDDHVTRTPAMRIGAGR